MNSAQVILRKSMMRFQICLQPILKFHCPLIRCFHRSKSGHSLGNLEDFHLHNSSSEIVGLLSCLPSALIMRFLEHLECEEVLTNTDLSRSKGAAVATSPSAGIRLEILDFRSRWFFTCTNCHKLFFSPGNAAFKEWAVDAKVKLGQIWDQL